MGRSRRKLKRPEPDLEALLAADRGRGLLLGAIAGEALARPGDGLERGEILRRFGRLAHVAAGTEVGPLGAATVARAQAVIDGTAGDVVATGDRDGFASLIAAGVAAFTGDLSSADEAASLLQGLVAIALATGPYERLPAAALLEVIAVRATSAATRAAVDALAAQALSPPAPLQALAPFAKLAPETAVVLGAAHALLVRPRSLEEAVVYAANLGGDGAARAAIAGMVAGAQRGGAAVPQRWREAIAGLEHAAALGLAVGSRRRHP